jgi:hypothetical protein
MFRSGCELARQASDDLACRDDLPGVALGMFGCVEEQPEDSAGELGTANRARREELFLLNLLQATHRVVYAHVNEEKQLLGRCRRRARVSLST